MILWNRKMKILLWKMERRITLLKMMKKDKVGDVEEYYLEEKK